MEEAVNKEGKKRRKNLLIALGVLALLFFVLAVYFTFFYSVNCKDLGCWDYKLQKCEKATYINNDGQVSWAYRIVSRNKEANLCEVNVKLKEIREGLVSSKALEGKEMICTIPLGVIINPDTDPNMCHGRLKEEMMGLIIKKLHEYILNNLGTLNENITKIEGVT